MSSASARRSSRSLLPTPENTIAVGGMPASRARRSSPSLTTSAPAPSAANSAQHREPVVRLHRVVDVRIQSGLGQRGRRACDSAGAWRTPNRPRPACRPHRRWRSAARHRSAARPSRAWQMRPRGDQLGHRGFRDAGRVVGLGSVHRRILERPLPGRNCRPASERPGKSCRAALAELRFSAGPRLAATATGRSSRERRTHPMSITSVTQSPWWPTTNGAAASSVRRRRPHPAALAPPRRRPAIPPPPGPSVPATRPSSSARSCRHSWSSSKGAAARRPAPRRRSQGPARRAPVPIRRGPARCRARTTAIITSLAPPRQGRIP